MNRMRIVVNPIAGKGLAPKMVELVNNCHPTRFTIDVCTTTGAGHARTLAHQAAQEGYAAVVAVGGDGTVNEVASALVHTDTALGILPAGSGNGLARHLGYSAHPKMMLQQLLNSNTDSIDTLRINGKPSFNVSGWGFDGWVAWRFNKEGKRGLSNYTRIALQEYLGYKGFDIEMQAENQTFTFENMHMLVMANASEFGNAARIAPKADLQDGRMDLVLVRKPSVFRLPALFYRLFKGTIRDNDYLHQLTCRQIHVKASRVLHLHLDGEAQEPCNELIAEILPRSLNILRPSR